MYITRYFLATVEIKNYDIKIDGKNFFDQPVRNNLETYDNIRKVESGQRDDYTTGCLLDYPSFKEHYKSIAIDFSKQQELDVDSKATQQINFSGNLNRAGNKTMFFIIEETKETILDFSQELQEYYKLILLWYNIK